MKKLTGVRKSARRRTKKSELVYGEIPVTKELLEPQNVFSSIERSKAQYPMGSDHLEDGRRYLSPDVFIKVHNESEPSPVRFDYNSAPLSARLLGISPEPTENRYINAAKEKKKLYHRMNDFIPTESIPVYEYDQHGPIPMDKYPAFEKPTFILADSPFNMVKEVPEEYDDGFDEPDLQDGYSIFQEDRFYILVGVFFGMLSAAIIIGFLILSYLVNK